MKPSHGTSLATRFKSARKSRQIHHVRLVNKIYSQLKKASPGSSGRTTGELAVDIGDLISVGRKHQEHVKRLLEMRFPGDREKFRKLLAQFEVNLLFENQWHLSSLKRLLPRLVRDAYGLSNGRRSMKK